MIYPPNSHTLPFIESIGWGVQHYGCIFNVRGHEETHSSQAEEKGFVLRVSGQKIPQDLEEGLKEQGVICKRVEQCVT